jgi:bifunctional non-homologous end joining protein LigD
MVALHEYQTRRNFRKTPEPKGEPMRSRSRPMFVVQEHHASRLHFDFRLEAAGVLKSWAVPRGPSLDPRVKRLAVRTEDHPLAYGNFQGTIPAGEYGAGEVILWDRGTYENLLAQKPQPMSVDEALEVGRLEFLLHGRKLRGRFALIRLKPSAARKESWLLIKMKDEYARTDDDSETPPPARHTSKKSDGAPPSEVVLTHPDKVLFPDDGITKRDIFAYYDRIAPHLLPFLKDRPIALERLPDGLGKTRFWQKNLPDSYPDWIPRVEIPTQKGKPVRYPVVNDRETLLYFVNQGTLTFHPWLSRVQDLDRPDFVLFDLDPDDSSFAETMAVAKQLHKVLQEMGQTAFVKTSGKRGLHVLVPWAEDGDFDAARAWAADVADRVIEDMPEVATREIRKAKRGRKVYIDIMQNTRGHHVVPPYVVRAAPGAPVSVPLRWSELKHGLTPTKYTIHTIFRRLSHQKHAPFEPWQSARAERKR